MRGLIGHTGFVGSNILEQSSFDKCYNSKNIESIAGEKFDTLVCAGVSSVKWKANKEPEEDFKQIQKLIHNLDQAEFQTLVLISTIAVYDNPADSAYGRHRLYLETYLMNQYENVYITRLPSLFGKGLKKNAIYDLINKDYRFVPSPWSYFQYYCLDNIGKDIQKQIDLGIKVLNINSERVPFDKVLNLFELNLEQFRRNKVVQENMLSDHGEHWGQPGNYLYTQEEILQQLKEFISHNE
jgi:nucleoside-diphosphate-sugar epimerase